MVAAASLTTCSALSPATATVTHFDARRLQFRVSLRKQYFCFSDSPAFRFSDDSTFRRSRRAISVVTRAGPSSSTYVFAFIFPLTLLAVTIFTAMRIGDRLDKKFLEELAMNQAIKEMDEDEDEDNATIFPLEKEPALPRTRNRPKREV